MFVKPVLHAKILEEATFAKIRMNVPTTKTLATIHYLAALTQKALMNASVSLALDPTFQKQVTYV